MFKINDQKKPKFGDEFACAIEHYAQVENYAWLEHILELNIMPIEHHAQVEHYARLEHIIKNKGLSRK